ncbi:MAG TPA: amidase [Vicinamibacteria bacterium]|nr:amidase [Vicinamibacteria bacterium]
MKRRAFVGCGTVAGVGSLVRTAGAAEPVAAEPVAVAAFELEEATVADLQKRMATGELTARRVTQAYLARIAALDRQGPDLRSVIETNPDAPAIADALDAERRTRGARGPLHGIPVLVKDNVDTADRMTTTAGSLALEGSTPPRDSGVAARLREAGAVILGKANLSEWANFRSNRSVSGWSARGGQCRNPYALDRNPCGSSSGSGVAVSANLAPLAVGTETDGSIVCPATTCGIVGIKPTVGLVSRAGIVPISHTQDTAGPMARTVADAAALLAALAGVDPRDPATTDGKGRASDYARVLDPDGLRGARIGAARNLAGFHPDTDRLFNGAVAEMKRRGAEVVDPVDVPNVKELGDPELEVMLFEFKADLEAYLASLGPKAPLKSLADAIAFNERNREREMPYFGQELFLKAQEKGPLTTPAYQDALQKCRRLSRKEGLDAVLDQHRLDALVAPTGAPAWVIDPVSGDHFVGGNSTPAAVAGYPNVSVPMGFVFGLPVGVSFIGRAWSEPTLVRLAFAFEQATKHRRPPRFLRTAELEA